MKKAPFILLLLFVLVGCKTTSTSTDNPPDTNDFIQITGSCPVNGDITRLAVTDYYAYIIDTAHRIHLVDIVNSYAPRLISSYDYLYSNIAVPIDIVVDWRKYAYISAGEDGLHVIDTNSQNGGGMTQIEHYLDYPHAGKMAINDDYLFMADGTKFWIFMRTTSSTIMQISQFDNLLGNTITALYLSYPYLYVGTESSFDIVDVTNPYNPQRVSSLSLPTVKDIDEDPITKRAFIATETGLFVLNVTNPNIIIQSAYYRTSYPLLTIQFDSGYLLAGSADRSIKLLDLHDLANVEQIDYHLFNDVPTEIEKNAGYYYVTCGVDGFYIVDLRNLK